MEHPSPQVACQLNGAPSCLTTARASETICTPEMTRRYILLFMTNISRATRTHKVPFHLIRRNKKVTMEKSRHQMLYTMQMRLQLLIMTTNTTLKHPRPRFLDGMTPPPNQMGLQLTTVDQSSSSTCPKALLYPAGDGRLSAMRHVQG